jgi:hypothetical protein
MRKFLIMPTIVAGVLMSSGAVAQPAPAQPQMQIDAPVKIANPYTAYEFLIGDWYTKPNGGPDVRIHQQFSWGTEKGSIKYTTLTNVGTAPEAVHFEGLLVWNGATKDVDYIIVTEPGSGGQEKGTLHVEADGTVVREVLLTRADGKTSQFRQRFWRENDAVFTSLMRKTAKGWEPNFPGSARLAMSRTPV